MNTNNSAYKLSTKQLLAGGPAQDEIRPGHNVSRCSSKQYPQDGDQNCLELESIVVPPYKWIWSMTKRSYQNCLQNHSTQELKKVTQRNAT